MKKIYALVFVSAVVAVSFLYFFRNEQLKGIILDASYPVFKMADTVEEFFLSVFKHFQSQSSIIEENRQLEKKIELLKARIIQLKKVEAENKKLKRLLQFTDKYPDYKLKVARIIGYSPDNWRDFVIVDAGSFDGIKKGDLVVANGLLLGQVYQVGAFSSSVILVSDKNFRISARCRKTGEFVFFQGKDRKEGRLMFVKPEQDIRIGDVVETEGFEKVPSGVPIGKIKSVSYVEGNFYKNVTVSLSLNPYSIEYVVIFSGKK
ncbi:rod shape-determining protein MreC [Persephonella atlantica]|uniref:Cell shape-determining protein MreC n=1 Tax=Persephonella atlantica TaxID=2699429 RepID=A0ABS1GJR7_9AQUI|nr:rod shape-determining protein MreC [Persephonella atlantica]MBK3333166.1 rod shape-determining protein MreC [Persephonella atlantica]